MSTKESEFDLAERAPEWSRPCLFCKAVEGLTPQQRADLDEALTRDLRTATYRKVLRSWGVDSTDRDIRRHKMIVPSAGTEACKWKFPKGRPA